MANKIPPNPVPEQGKVVALTFDDGPDKQVPKLMELFAQYDAKATFFAVGKNLEKFPEIAKAASDAGHEIGNHSFFHPKLNEMAEEAVRNEIVRTQNLIRQITGKAPVSFRAPYLAYGGCTLKIIKELGLTSVNVTRSTRDWDPSTTTEQIVERSLRDIASGDVILMHSWSLNTFNALPEILLCLTEKGFRCITVSELQGLALKQS